MTNNKSLTEIQTKPQQLALFGHPVVHSQSPKIHQGFAAQFGLNIEYHLIDVDASMLWAQVHQFFAQGGKGANVTVPHKQHIIPALDAITERATLAGAVNTLFIKDNQLWGDNTDGDGFVMDLKSKGISLKGSQILIIGAGGATQGIIPSLLSQDIELIEIQNRDREKANRLAAQFNNGRVSVAGFKMPCSYDLVIHATSMGHQGLAPELKDRNFHMDTIAYDLSYGQAAKPFLNAAKSIRVKETHDGLGMLYGQAALAFDIWFQKRPHIESN